MENHFSLPYTHPATADEVRALVDARETESLHLEFKSSEALLNKNQDEISKDISAFANADGGLLIYGIVEKDHHADHVDEGVSSATRSKEWLESKIQSNVSPRLPNLRITAIEISAGMFIYAVSVPPSDRGPHQHRPSYRYYKRRNFKCEPMEDYEVRDARSRRVDQQPLVNVSMEITQGSLLQLCVENKGDFSAENVLFEFSPDLNWHREKPKALRDGIKSFPPRRRLAYFYCLGHEIGGEKVTREFDVDVSYFHPGMHREISDSFGIDLSMFQETLSQYSDVERHTQSMEGSLKKIVTALEAISKNLVPLGNLAGPTGLDLSFSTLKSVDSIINAHFLTLPRLTPKHCSWQVFQEVLDIDTDLAIRLHRYFLFSSKNDSLSDVDGLNDEIMCRLKLHFRI